MSPLHEIWIMENHRPAHCCLLSDLWGWRFYYQRWLVLNEPLQLQPSTNDFMILQELDVILRCEREIQKYIPVFSTILFCISLFYLFGKCNLPFFYNSNSRKNYSILKTILLFKFIISWIPSREVSRKLTAKTNCP